MSHLALHDHGLVGIEGANTVISSIHHLLQPVSELSLGHNTLGSSGTNHLFSRLLSLRQAALAHLPPSVPPTNSYIKTSNGPRDNSSKWTLEKITLSGNAITGDGLKALGEYLDGNEELREVYLPHNAIDGSAVLHLFASKILKSRLTVLSLNTNPISPEGLRGLIDGLSGIVLPASLLSPATTDTVTPPIPSPTPPKSPLTTLHLSLLPLSLPGLLPLLPFLSSPSLSSNLTNLYLNSCQLSWRGLYLLSLVLENHNLDLEQVEVSSNYVRSEDWLGEGFADDGGGDAAVAEGGPEGEAGGPGGLGLRIHIPATEEESTGSDEGKLRHRLIDVLERTMEMGEHVIEQDWVAMERIARRPYSRSRFREADGPIDINAKDKNENHEVPEGQDARRRRRRKPPPEMFWLSESDSPTYKLRAWCLGLRVLLQTASLNETTPRTSFVSGPLHNSPAGLPSSSSFFPRGISDAPSPITAPFLNSLALSLQESCLERIKLLTRRNRELKTRVQKCALGCLPIARIVLLGRRKTKEEEERDRAKALIKEVEGEGSSTSARSVQTGWMIPPSSRAWSSPLSIAVGPFRLLDLPPDIILTILKHTTTAGHDLNPAFADVLSEEQWRKLLDYAGSKATLEEEVRQGAAIKEAARIQASASSGRKAFVFQDGLSRSYPLPGRDEAATSSTTPAFRPGPGHFGRSEWLHIVGVAGRAGSWASQKSGGMFPGYMPVGLEEKTNVDEMLHGLGLMRWDDGQAV